MMMEIFNIRYTLYEMVWNEWMFIILYFVSSIFYFFFILLDKNQIPIHDKASSMSFVYWNIGSMYVCINTVVTLQWSRMRNNASFDRKQKIKWCCGSLYAPMFGYSCMVRCNKNSNNSKRIWMEHTQLQAIKWSIHSNVCVPMWVYFHLK